MYGTASFFVVVTFEPWVAVGVFESFNTVFDSFVVSFVWFCSGSSDDVGEGDGDIVLPIVIAVDLSDIETGLSDESFPASIDVNFIVSLYTG